MGVLSRKLISDIGRLDALNLPVSRVTLSTEGASFKICAETSGLKLRVTRKHFNSQIEHEYTLWSLLGVMIPTTNRGSNAQKRRETVF